MKKTINDYTFYKIINVNCDVELCYVGSTVDMKQRVSAHKSNTNNPNCPKHHLKVYKTIREHGGWDEFRMIPIGYAEQLTLTEAHVIEEKYRVELCADLNTLRCHITEEQHKQTRKLHKKVYNEKNKEAITEYKRVYRQNNKELIREQEKLSNERRKDKKAAWKSKKITCDCGCVISHGSKTVHCKSKKHINLMNNKNNIELIHNE